MQYKLTIGNAVSWAFGLLLVVIGIMNMVLVHPVPGIFYILLSLLYLLPVNVVLRERLGFSIPPLVKIILGVVVMWVTLAVGDLAELYGL